MELDQYFYRYIYKVTGRPPVNYGFHIRENGLTAFFLGFLSYFMFYVLCSPPFHLNSIFVVERRRGRVVRAARLR